MKTAEISRSHDSRLQPTISTPRLIGEGSLVESLEKNSPNSFFVYSSSISVYGDRLQNPNIKVTDSLLPSQGDEYAVTKIEAERLIQNSALDWSIFRLAAVLVAQLKYTNKLV